MFTLKQVNGNLVLTIPLNTPVDCKPQAKSGQVKNQSVATTHGFVTTDIVVNGKPLRFNFLAMIAK